MNREHIRSIFAQWCHRLFAAENGQALPITLGILALGSLLIGPFLNNAGTGMISSRNYSVLLYENYAADAGVEHAIWSLTDTSLPSLIPDEGDSYNYNLSYTVNGITPGVTVSRLTPGGGGAAGTIGDTVADSYEYDPANGYTPNIVAVSGDVYAIVYRGSSNYGYLKTINIAADGAITKSVIDSYTFSGTAVGYEPQIIHISGDVYAIVCRGTSNYGYLRTVNIAANGTITKSVIDSYTFSGTAVAYTPYIIPVSGNVYAIVCRGSSNYGYLRTVTIATNGTITKSIIDSYTFSGTAVAYEMEIIHVSGEVYAISYRGSGSDGYLRTVSIAANGTITKSIIDTLVFSTTANTPDIIHASGDIYAIVYRGSGNGGILCTVDIASDGTIANSVTDSYQFDNNGYEPDILSIAGDVYAVAYRGSGSRGDMGTLTISSGGAITQSFIDSLIYDSSSGYEPDIIHVSGNTFAIVYRGSGNDGFIVTVSITTASGNDNYRIQSAAGSSIITAEVSIDAGSTVKVTSWLISRQE